jgi:hypothetical protein
MKILIFDGDKILYQSGSGFDNVAPKSKKDAAKLIVDLKKEISKLEKIVDNFDRENKVIDEGRVAFYTSDMQTINALEFKNGLADFEIDLGDEFLFNKSISIGSLKFIAASDIYYKKTLIVPKGKEIPHFKLVQIWSDKEYMDKKAKVILDLRPPGVYGTDFRSKLLNNGRIKRGKYFGIRFYAEYKYPVT